MEMISFGTVFLELVFGQLHRLPAPGEEVFTDEFAISCGGAVTSATAAAAAGVRAGLCTRLGDDRGFVTHLPPSAAAGEQAEIQRWHSVVRAERPAWCYLHPGRRVPPFLRAARSVGCKIMLDMSLGDETERDSVIECVRLADIFVPNAAELMALTGAADLAAAICSAAAWGAQLVVTRGAQGALVAGRDGSVIEVADGVKEVRVRDLTGAGDNFAGALIAALIGGASLTQAVAAANAAGSQAVGRLGAVGELGTESTGA